MLDKRKYVALITPAWLLASQELMSTSLQSHAGEIVVLPDVLRVAADAAGDAGPLLKVFFRCLARLHLASFITETPIVPPLDPIVQKDLETEYQSQLAHAHETARRMDPGRALVSKGERVICEVTDTWLQLQSVLPLIIGACNSNPALRVLCTAREEPYIRIAKLPIHQVKPRLDTAPLHDRVARHILNILLHLYNFSFIFFFFVIAPFALWLIGFIVVHIPPPAWFMGSMILFLGACLYWFRCRARLLYGVVEMWIGVFLAYQSVPVNTESIVAWLPAGVSLYVIVRGLDNIGKALHRSRHDRLWTRVFGPD